jgi:Leucine-rich repeat (LRR) protein
MKITMLFVVATAMTLSMYGQSRRADSLALVDFYGATKGTEWVEDSNWVSEAPLELWHGVTTSEEGRVIGLRLPSNNLVGFLPFSIGQLNYLEVLDLAQNRIGGEFPVSLNKLVNLVELNMNDNRMKCDLPITLASCFSLRILRLARNQYLGELPYNFADLTRLEVIDLSGNQIAGALPFDIGRITNLRILRAPNNLLTGSLPLSIGQLSALELIDLASNKITGSIPGTIGGCFALEELYLQRNAMRDTLTERIGVLRKLRRLNLSSNTFSGPIPATIGGCLALEQLNLSDNAFADAVPEAIGECDSLRELYLENNKLTGPLPDTLASCTKLRHLWVGGNPIGGQLPTWLDSLHSLVTLSMREIQAEGEIPASMGSLDSLKLLDLSGNMLTGGVPDSFLAMDSLVTVAMHGNDLTSGLINLPKREYRILTVNDNRFDFADIVPANHQATVLYRYAPQDSIGVAIDTLVEKGTTYVIAAETDDADSNVYTWYKNGVEFPDIKGRDFVINPVRHSDSGVYTCKVTNNQAPDLTLYRRPVLVRVEPDEPDDTTSVYDDELRRSITMWPQPASTQLFMRSTTSEPFVVDVLDMRGAVVMPAMRVESALHRFDTTILPTGMYVVRIRTMRATTSMPLLIED